MKNLLLAIFLIIASSFFCSITSAQTSNCGTDESIEKAKKSDISYKNYLENNSKGTGSPANIIPDNTTIYTVPIIFIVYHLGEAVGTGTNVSDANIQAALAYMNTEWRASTPQFANGNDTKMQFAMAQRSPSCQPINGIVRVNASGVSGYASGGVPPGSAMEQTIRNLTPEYNQLQLGKYCIVRIVTGVPPYAGYAYYGGDVLFNYNYVNGNANNTLLAHEMGHVFFLPHTFQGSNYDSGTNTYTCPNNANPSVDGDGIADTDPHKQNDYDCINTSNTNSCTGLPFGNILKNFMSYANTSCIDRFTAGQIYKMRYSLLNSTTGLLDPLTLTTPTAAENVTASSCGITTGSSAVNGYYTGISNFTFNDINNNSDNIPLFYGFYKNYSCFQKTTVTAGQTYPLQITVSNGLNRRVYIDYDDNGVFNETTELVFNNTAGANGNITISNTSVKNKYLRMRVLSSPINTSFSACNLPSDATYGYGEIEDYGLQILNAPPPTIAFASPFLTGTCVASNTFVGFTTTGFFNAGNEFKVQLSDASGIFPTTPTVISSGYISGSNIIGVLFLANLTSSTSYKIRIIATNPSTISPESTAFGILNTPVITASSTVICTGGSSILSTPTLSGASYQWIKDNVDIGGATGNSYTTSTSGIYQIRITISGCVKISNLITLNSYQIPFISYSGSSTFCSGSTLTLTAFPNNSSTTYQWRKDGVDISGATASTYAATSSGAYSVRVTQGSCTPAISSQTILAVTGINSLDFATSLYGGTDASLNYNVYSQPFNICSGSMILSTTQRSASTTYQWQLDGVDILGETNATYTASQTGYYSVKIVQGTCTGASTPVALRIGSLTPPSLGSDLSICTGATHTINNNIYQGQNCCGTGLSYQWAKDGVDIPSATNLSSYSANTAGAYTLRVSQGACTATSAPMRLTVGSSITSPTINNSLVSEIPCSGTSFQLITFNSLSNQTYQWIKDGVDIPSATSNFYNSTLSGKYQVRLTQGSCSAISSEIQQIFGELGNLFISGNNRFCSPNSTTLSSSTACGDYSYQWKRNGIAISGATLSSYTTNVPAVYTLDITKGTKTITTNSLSVYEDCSTTTTTTINTPFISSNASDRVICANSGKQMIFTSNQASQYPTVTYQWYKDGVTMAGQKSRFLFVTDAGNYQVQLVVGASQSALSSVYSMYNSGNNLSLNTLNGTYGCTEVLLSSAIPNSTTKLPYTYQWKKDGVNIGTNQNFYNATASGNYTLDVTLGTCTISSLAVPVTIGNSSPSIISSPSSNRLCDNGYITMNTNLGNTFVHQWYKDNVLIPNINSNRYTATTAGNYTFTANQGTCAYSSSAAVPVTSTSFVIPSIGSIGGFSSSSNSSISACVGSNLTLTVDPKRGIYQYQWKNAGAIISGANTATYQPSSSGTYSADITTLGGCVVTSPILTLDLGITPSPSFTNSSTLGSNLCSGSTANLSVGNGSFNTYQWYKDDVLIPNATSTIYSATLAGRYNVKLTQGACAVETGYIPVSLNSTTLTPRVSNASTSIDVSCNLISANLSTSSINGGTYQWQRNGVNVIGQTNSFYNTTQNGTYQVIVNQGTCTGTSNPIEIQNGVASLIYPNGPFGFICGEGASILTNFIGSGGTYQWRKNGVNIGTNSSFLSINGLGTYTVTNTLNGCSATSQPFIVSSISPMESAKTGLWNNSGVWNCLRTPNVSDNVKVNFGHIVSLPNTSTYLVKSINNEGNVSFGTGSNLRIGF